VERGCRLGRVELGVAPHRLARRQLLDLDPLPLQLLDGVCVRPHAAVGACPDDQALGQLREYGVEILEHERMPLASPPILQHSARKHDYVVRVLLAVDEHAAKAVSLDPRHATSTLAAVDGKKLQDFIDRYNDAWNAHDVERIVSMHTEDSVFENHTTGDVNVGKDAIRAAITGIFSVFPDLTFEGRRQYIREDLVVQEWTARGTHQGTMRRSGMEVPPTSRRVEYRGMDVIPIENGRVARKDVYSDGVTLLRQLGLTEIS
jgi:steroid delta-isomerase-like uncharacterized protein